MNRSTFVERHGDPAKFIFKGQYYDARPSKVKCAVCGQDGHLAFVLRNDRDRSTPISSCCISLFKLWNPLVYTQLQAALVLLDASIAAEEADRRIFVPLMLIRTRRDSWRTMKRKALGVIRAYKVKTGKEWLPESLFDLKVTAEQKPGDYKKANTLVRWYDRQTTDMETIIQKVAQ